ncbi:hypothetical protein CONPUDRAFT_70481 [Coniophora puteana RWD-64-598 SS2]|uniref:F-box domain-containing protein n=1 Tax=Coniophora puteana (strain RWD-64-598) TaxID=741705 RepID=A0A5M3N317_CONPW|nr:uncharacterized protein CONPUDRAFT_70481 [Coniophora puteana RWD-64-598 SS2]EIW85758.1 hypothetical protein CONPUDRAFT_70481 [Coniophora puteana RWD-64-598 SS2]
MKTTYWKSVVIMLDSTLEWSVIKICLDVFERLETIKLHLVSSDRADIDASLENTYYSLLMRLLAPHFHKCKIISIDVWYRSTIVAVSYFLNNLVARNLVKLSLLSYITDSAKDAAFTSFISPRLTALSVDAKTFVAFAEARGETGVEIKFGRNLSVTSYHPEDKSPNLTEPELISAIVRFTDTYGCLSDLAVEDVLFDRLDDNEPEYVRTVNDVSFVDMDASFLRAFFGYFDPPWAEGDQGMLSLTHCRLDLPSGARFMADLVLTEIDDSATILRVLELWNGLTVDITDCPGFTDDVLDVMVRDYHCGYVSTFTFTNCPISVAGVRRFVSSRRPSDFFEELHVWGAPSLNDADRVWFKEKVPVELTWNDEVLK